MSAEQVEGGFGALWTASERATARATDESFLRPTMVDPLTGGPHTAHTTNPVPVIVKGAPEGLWDGFVPLKRGADVGGIGGRLQLDGAVAARTLDAEAALVD